jgi:hypothetical protein
MESKSEVPRHSKLVKNAHNTPAIIVTNFEWSSLVAKEKLSAKIVELTKLRITILRQESCCGYSTREYFLGLPQIFIDRYRSFCSQDRRSPLQYDPDHRRGLRPIAPRELTHFLIDRQ